VRTRVVPDTHCRRQSSTCESAYAVVHRGRARGAPGHYPPAVPVTESLRDDLRQHVNNILTKLVSITLVLVTVTAYMDRNTDYNS